MKYTKVVLVVAVAVAAPLPQQNGQALFVRGVTELAPHLSNPEDAEAFAKQADAKLSVLRTWDARLLNGPGPIAPGAGTVVLGAVLALFAVYWVGRLADRGVGPVEKYLGHAVPGGYVLLTLVSPSTAAILAALHTYFELGAPVRVVLVPVRV